MTQNEQNQVWFLLFLMGAILLGCIFDASAAEPTPKIAHAIVKSARRYKLDPNLVLAIVEVESNFNVNARGTHGEVGLYQLHPQYHADIPRSVYKQIDYGSRYLSWVRQQCLHRYGDAWIVCYNAGPNCRIIHPLRNPYYIRVMGIYERRRTIDALIAIAN